MGRCVARWATAAEPEEEPLVTVVELATMRVELLALADDRSGHHCLSRRYHAVKRRGLNAAGDGSAPDEKGSGVLYRGGRKIWPFRRPWKKVREKADLPGMLFHDLRRSAVRNLEGAGTTRLVAMTLTEHKTENVYRRYAIIAESDLTREPSWRRLSRMRTVQLQHPGQIR